MLHWQKTAVRFLIVMDNKNNFATYPEIHKKIKSIRIFIMIQNVVCYHKVYLIDPCVSVCVTSVPRLPLVKPVSLQLKLKC